MIFYYDVVCPFAYLASTQIEAVAARAGATMPVTIEWRPVLLGGIFRAIGSDEALSMPMPKARLNLLDMHRYAALYGVPLKVHPEHPRRSVEAMRLLHVVDGAERVALTHALYRAYFVRNLDISRREALAEACADAGLPPTLVERIDEPAIKDALRAATDEAVAAGAFGVPTFIVAQGGRRHLFWGQDRLMLVERALSGWQVPA